MAADPPQDSELDHVSSDGPNMPTGKDGIADEQLQNAEKVQNAKKVQNAASQHDELASPVVSSRGKRPRNRVRRMVVAGCFGIGTAVFLQWNATTTDHQDANLATLVVGLAIGFYVLFQIHCLAAANWNGFVLPLSIAAVLLAVIYLYEFKGFSGELVPQFSFRFSDDRLELRTVDGADEVPIDRDAQLDDAAIAQTGSFGFLGSDRTAVIVDRDFAIPATIEDVQTLWRQGLGEGWSAFAVSGDSAVTLEQRGEDECVTCYRLSDGKLLWLVKHKAFHSNLMGGAGPRSTPVIVGDLVFAQGATGRVWCIDWKTGLTVWTVDLLKQAGWVQAESEAMITWGRAASPLIVDGNVCVVPFGGPAANTKTGRSLIALDAATGKTIWAAGEGQVSYASAALLTLGGVRQIVSVNEKTITGHQIADGDVLWQVDWLGQSNGGANCAMVIPAGENQFLVGKGYGGGSALFQVTQADGEWNAEALWKSSRVLKTKFTHAAVMGEFAFAISNGSLEAVSISDGERQWMQGRNARLGQGQILLVDDVIVGQSESGEVVLVAADPEKYRELLRLPALTSKTWNVPTIAGRHLLVRNDREVICFLLPKRSTDVGAE